MQGAKTMTKYTELPLTFADWRAYAFYTRDDCSRIFKVTRRTVNNGESGRIKPPFGVIICLQMFAGRLDHLGKAWRGFHITPECIESPDGDFVRLNEIRALRYAMQALEINRQKRCRMNENEKGIVRALLKQ
jgi:DNA-binding XRE family transcriptional regulator